MSIQSIIQSLEILVISHKALLDISKQKTDVIKEGSIEELQPLLVQERKQIQVLEQAEKKRQYEVTNWFDGIPTYKGNATITDMLAIMTDTKEKKELEQATIVLTRVITELKWQEELNQTLMQQSLQFIEVSLNMMNPSLKSMNYGPNKEINANKRSVFDSKA